MKKFFVILLLAFIATSTAYQTFEEEQGERFSYKLNAFLIHIIFIPRYYNMYEKIYYNKYDTDSWPKLADKIKELVTEYEDKGDGEIEEYAEEFCTGTMHYETYRAIASCKDFIEYFHNYVK